ncbi:hypothetical protein EGJ27_24630 [Pseudomonas sp. v388]|uniref:hypothetical protein n=1 Tax=Pseudomonas sp. v388 TaxID=2479849 RepID=UPI000F79212C|nr:hypothetical protein [Pseudomonas sp. v388]RRV03579.1 hypothetical protein EGJ27_24630 [Pseudomonas sp. v388]
MNYDKVSASLPPQLLIGLWSGPHAGGTVFINVFEEGNLQGCLSAPPYFHEMKGKYFRHALYFEDGSRLRVRSVKAHELVIESAPGLYVAKLTPDKDNAQVVRCSTLAAHMAP